MAPTDHREPVRKNLGRMARELWLPLVVGVGWALWGYHSATAEKPATWKGFLGDLGAAFFFTGWITGQYIRVSKQARVEAHLGEIHERAAHILTLLTARLPAPHAPPPVVEPPAVTPVPAPPLPGPVQPVPLPPSGPSRPVTGAPVARPAENPSTAPRGVTSEGTAGAGGDTKASATVETSGKTSAMAEKRTAATSVLVSDGVAALGLIAEAERAASADMRGASIVLAGAALEPAARYLLEMRGVPLASSAPMGEVLQLARKEIGAELADELLRLWTLRNRVAHSTRLDDVRLPAAGQAVDAFKSVVAALIDAAKRNATFTGIPCPRCRRLTMGSGGGENVCGNCGFVSHED